eukprot:scaffold91516_cov42-Prasinocladus_malaysianus.AAC.1
MAGATPAAGAERQAGGAPRQSAASEDRKNTARSIGRARNVGVFHGLRHPPGMGPSHTASKIQNLIQNFRLAIVVAPYSAGAGSYTSYELNRVAVEYMNHLPGTSDWPRELGGGRVREPRGVAVSGDL